MKIIAFIERRDQPDVVERILKHCGLWDRPASRAPPPQEPEQLDLELQYVDTDEPRRSRDGLPDRQQRNEVEWQFLMAL